MNAISKYSIKIVDNIYIFMSTLKGEYHVLLVIFVQLDL